MEAIRLAGSKEVRLDPELLLVLHDCLGMMVLRSVVLVMHGDALMAVLSCEPFSLLGRTLLAEIL